jgi:hypothetical protein
VYCVLSHSCSKFGVIMKGGQSYTSICNWGFIPCVQYSYVGRTGARSVSRTPFNMQNDFVMSGRETPLLCELV